MKLTTASYLNFLLELNAIHLNFANKSYIFPSFVLTCLIPTFSFYNTPLCLTNYSIYSSACLALNPTYHTYEAAPICDASCHETNLPNPFIYDFYRQCNCSGYVLVNLTLTDSSFEVFTPVAAKLLGKALANKLHISPSRVRLKKEKWGEGGR